MDYTFFNHSELEKFILHHSRLQTGDKLEGTVIEVRRDKRVLMDFGEFRALAETSLSVEPGQTIRVVVVSRVPKLQLRLEASDPVRKVPPGVQLEPKEVKKQEKTPKLDIKV